MQVKQLCCDGSISQVCSLGGGSHASLVAVLADRLLLMRSASTGAGGISSRFLSVLEPLLRGWASLAAMGILPGVAARKSAHVCRRTRPSTEQKLLKMLQGTAMSSHDSMTHCSQTFLSRWPVACALRDGQAVSAV